MSTGRLSRRNTNPGPHADARHVLYAALRQRPEQLRGRKVDLPMAGLVGWWRFPDRSWLGPRHLVTWTMRGNPERLRAVAACGPSRSTAIHAPRRRRRDTVCALCAEQLLELAVGLMAQQRGIPVVYRDRLLTLRLHEALTNLTTEDRCRVGVFVGQASEELTASGQLWLGLMDQVELACVYTTRRPIGDVLRAAIDELSWLQRNELATWLMLRIERTRDVVLARVLDGVAGELLYANALERSTFGHLEAAFAAIDDEQHTASDVDNTAASA